MKPRKLLAITLFTLLGLTCAACGGTSRNSNSSSGTAATARTGARAGAPVGLKSLPQDEDDDDGPGEEVGSNPHDSDVDGDNDNLKPLGYYDRDDAPTRMYGHAANAAEKKELIALTERYYAAVVADDGSAACSMLTPAFAGSVTEDYGHGSAGPAYLRSADSCPVVLTLLFKHLHAQLTAPIEVVAVRVKGKTGLVLIGATGMPASYLEAQHEADGWRAIGLLASALS